MSERSDLYAVVSLSGGLLDSVTILTEEEEALDLAESIVRDDMWRDDEDQVWVAKGSHVIWSSADEDDLATARAVEDPDIEDEGEDEEDPTYEIVVGNVGSVWKGKGYATAKAMYEEYVEMSMSGRGRAAGENVTLLEGGEIIEELND